MNSICKVNDCRFPASHNTYSHLCGTCKKYGHGQVECHHQHLKDALLLDPDYAITIDPSIMCTIDGCRYSHTHTSNAHHCSYCLGNHSHKICTQNNKSQLVKQIECPLCRTQNKFFTNTDINIYGVDTKCCICLENECNVLMPKCHHVCVCKDCYDKLN